MAKRKGTPEVIIVDEDDTMDSRDDVMLPTPQAMRMDLGWGNSRASPTILSDDVAYG